MKNLNLKKHLTKALCMMSAAILCGAARAEEPVGDQEAGEAAEAAEAEEEEAAAVSYEFSLAFDSKYLSYGFVDNNHPILTPSGSITFFDWFSIGAYAIFDITKYGHRHGYTSRQWQCTEFHPNAEIRHSFGEEDFAWLPTTVELAIGYDYEYVPNCKHNGTKLYDDDDNFIGYDKSWDEDTQYWTVEIGLPDLWLEPCFYCEFDTMRDHGIYMNLEIGHTFDVIDDTLTIRPSIAQGWGNAQRIAAYAWTSDYSERGYSALMDTMVKVEAEWTICDWLSLSGYVGYSDFLFDGGLRDSARRYTENELGNVTWEHSWNFIAGLALTASF